MLRTTHLVVLLAAPGCAAAAGGAGGRALSLIHTRPEYRKPWGLPEV